MVTIESRGGVVHALPAPTVFIVDDDEVVREGLKLLLESAGYQVACFERGEELLGSLDPSAVGCVVLDVELPGLQGPEIQAELVRRGSHLPVLFLTGHGDVPTAVQAMRAGAFDVLVKPADAEVILDRIAELVSRDVALMTAQERILHRFGTLTLREREVMALVAEGLANKDVGERLGISFRTVEVHRARVLRKTGCSSVVELARFVAQARDSKLLH